MPDETLLQAWDWFCRDGAPPNVGSIHIGSGEPLLAEPMLRKVGDLVRHSHGCGGESGVVVHLTTNGTVMTNPCRR
jgi:sulfatase maturation enzyme AslB (radical SAM superfamily)